MHSPDEAGWMLLGMNEGEHGGAAGWSWRFRQGVTKIQEFAELPKQAERPEKSLASTVG